MCNVRMRDFKDYTERGEEFATKMSNFINGSRNDDEETFVDIVANREHRTLSQKSVRLFLRVIEEMAEKPSRLTDARNEAAAKVSRELIDAFKKTHDGFKPSDYLPLI